MSAGDAIDYWDPAQPLDRPPPYVDVDDGDDAVLPADDVEPEPPAGSSSGPPDEAGALAVPFAGPFYPADDYQGRGPSKSLAVIAVKRAVSRWRPELFPWVAFDEHYNLRLAEALRALQRQAGIDPTGAYGHATHNALRAQRRQLNRSEWAFDATAVRILEDATTPAPPSRELAAEHVRAAITAYCKVSIEHALAWHYLQRRPMTTLGRPAGLGGYGNTDTLLRHSNAHRVSSYLVGDLAIYGDGARTKHVATCYQAGDVNSSAWCSHGSEAGPFPVRLRYRGDLLAVVRPRMFVEL